MCEAEKQKGALCSMSTNALQRVVHEDNVP